MRSILADSLFANGDSGAIHQRMETIKFLQCGGHSRLPVLFARDIALDITRVLAESCGQSFALRLVDVGNDGVSSRSNHHFCGSRTESGTSTGDDKRAVSDFHVLGFASAEDKGAEYSSECLEIAPQSLDGRERSKGCSFGAQDARPEPDRLESSRLRELNFNRRKSAFRTDQQH